MADKPVTYYNRPIDSSIGTTTNVDFSKDLVLDHESEAPLTALLHKLKDEKTETVNFKYAIGRMAPRSSTTSDAVAAAAADTLTNVPVVNPEYFVEGDIIEVPADYDDATHDSQLQVQSISGSNLQCKAYDPSLGVAQVDAGAVVRRISSAMIEGSSGRKSSQTVPTVYEQYCTSFEDYFDVSRIQDANRQYTHPERVRLREEARKKHIIDHEYAYFFSKKVLDTDQTKPRYQMGGIWHQITTNVFSYGAALSSDELFQYMMLVHKPAYSAGNKRLVLSSASFLAEVNKLGLSGVRITPMDTKWGVQIFQVVFAGFQWDFVIAPALSEHKDGSAVVVQPRYLKKRTLIPTVYEMNVQNPIDKFYRDGFYSVDSVEFKLEETAARISP